MSSMDDLTTWLRAQLDADEFLFRHWPGDPTTMTGYDGRGGATAFWSPQLALAEVGAKRQRLDWITGQLADDPADETAQWLLQIDALPHADRDGYREEWRT